MSILKRNEVPRSSGTAPTDDSHGTGPQAPHGSASEGSKRQRLTTSGFISSVISDVKDAYLRILQIARVDTYCQSGLIAIAMVCCVLLSLDVALRLGVLFENDVARDLWRDGSFRLDRKHSFPELAEYGLMSISGCLLLATSVRSGIVIYGLFGMIGIYLALDNALGLHGSFGHIAGLGHFWSERLYLIMIALPILVLLTAGVHKTKQPERGLAWLILGTLFLFVIFAGGVDAINAVHSRFPVPIAEVHQVVDHLLDLLEDGGELVATGLFAATALAVFRLCSSSGLNNASGEGAERV